MTTPLARPGTGAPVPPLLRTVPGWVLVLVVAAGASAPVIVIAASVLDPDVEMWRRLWDTRLPGMIRDTAILLLTVVPGATVLGVSLAWLVTAVHLPCRRLVGWALVTPLAVPGYVLGFVWLDTLEDVVGARAVRSIWLCALVLTLTLYPYVYLLARAAFREQSATPEMVARSLGCSAWRAWWRVTLPTARPAIAAGAALVGMEVLTDVGTVRLFNVSTVADGVLRVWFGTGDRGAAAELATVLVATTLVLIGVERWSRGGVRHAVAQRGAARSPRRLGTWTTVASYVVVVAVLSTAVVVPVVRLVRWAIEASRAGRAVSVSGDVWFHVSASLRVAGAATVVCVAIGIVLAWLARHRGSPARAAARLATLGYAVPGPVIAVGVVITLAALDRRGWLPGGALLVGSFVGLVYGLVVRFLAVGVHGVEAGLDKVPASTIGAARTLGARPWRVATRVELPAVRAGVLASAALVAADVLKELPITLLLRPFGTDTLPVWVWQATSESLWQQAAVPALALVALGMVPVAVLLWAMERGAEVVS